jgi:predicted nuclease of predicted toxin-antitoxin system
MKLLLDANISWRLPAKLKEHFTDCVHVDKIGLSIPVKDAEIWNYAPRSEFIIVTNDEDFLNFGTVKGFPPKVVLLRTGNQSSQYVEDY